jgi:COMPASS component SWD2
VLAKEKIIVSIIKIFVFNLILDRIMYWSLHDNNILCSFIGHTDTITHLDLNPLNSTFVSCSKDNTTRVWEYEKK